MTGMHVVSGADFAALAAGRGDAGVVDRLRAGQYSRNLLLLRELLDRAPESATALRDGYSLLVRVHEKSPDAVSTALTRPHVSAWLAQTVRNHQAGDTEFGHLAGVAAAAALAAAMDFEIGAPVRAGEIVLPGAGRARVAGDGGIATVRGSGGVLTIDGEAPQGWRPVHRLTGAVSPPSLVLDLDDVDWYRDCHGMGATDRLDAGQVAGWQKSLEESWAILARDHREYAEAIAAGLTTLVPLRTDLTNRGVTATSVDAFGAMALSAPADAMALAVGLVHEFQHAKLGALMDLVTLHESDDRRYYAPWRDDPRPLGGLLHGAYAFLGVTDFWRVRRRHDDEHRGYAEFEFARWRERVSRVIEVLAGSGRLTDDGMAFLAGMRTTVDGWWDEAVSTEAAGLARQAADDHRLSWRVRNLRCDPAPVRALADAWLAGAAAAPAVTVPVHTHASPQVFRRPARLHLIAMRVTGSDAEAHAGAVPEASGADLAYAAGDLAEAATRYRELIAAEPEHAEHWAGLALSLHDDPGPAAEALRAAPEVVAAVYGAAGDRPDPVALTAWLAPAVTGSAARSR
jgi:HEXXH motif-containing protein